MPDQRYRGTHRHRPPLGWHPTRKEPETTRGAGPDTQPSPEAHPDPPETVTADSEPSAPVAQPDRVSQAEPESEAASVDEASQPLPAPAQPAVVSGAYRYLKRWTFVLVVAGVWIVAAAIGLGLYYWWFHSFDKTPPVFVVLLFVIVCTVGALLTAMVQNKPLISALAVALMSAPLAAVGGAAVLHGIYFCDRAARCLVGLIPY